MEKGFIVSIIFAGVIALFALSNSAKVPIDLFFTEVKISQAIVILVSTLFGAIIAAILAGVRSLKLKKEVKQLKQVVADSDNQLKTSYESLEEEKKRLETLVDSLEKDKQELRVLLDSQGPERNNGNLEMVIDSQNHEILLDQENQGIDSVE